MRIPIYFGQKCYGFVGNADGTVAATQFFHIYYIPLFPLKGVTIRGYDADKGTGRMTPAGLDWRSVLYTYIRIWGFFGAIGLAFWAFDALMRPPTTQEALVPPAIALVAMWGVIASWFFLGLRKRPSPPSRKVMIPVTFAAFTLGLCLTFHYRFGDRSFKYSTTQSSVTQDSAALEEKRKALADWSRLNTPEAAEQACKSGNAERCQYLGVLYLSGLGVAKNPSRAIDFFDLSCQSKGATGCVALGNVLSDGNNVAKDIPRALKAYEQGCHLGDRSACQKVADSRPKKSVTSGRRR